MKKMVILWLLCLTFSGCALFKPSNQVTIQPAINTEECKNVAPIWWGRAGQDPTKDNKVWACYNWVIEAQEKRS